MKRFFRLTKQFQHPLLTYEAGVVLSAQKWAVILGHEMTPERFIQLVKENQLSCFEEVQTYETCDSYGRDKNIWGFKKRGVIPKFKM